MQQNELDTVWAQLLNVMSFPKYSSNDGDTKNQNEDQVYDCRPKEDREEYMRSKRFTKRPV
jgi:hypothetical protein